MNKTVTRVLGMRMRDLQTNEIGKATKKKMSVYEIQVLEQEYYKMGPSKSKWNKREIKRIAKKLNVGAPRVYKWFWDKRNQEK